MLVSVVVPHEESTKKWAYSNGHMGSFSELCSLDQLKDYVLSELNCAAEKKKVIVLGFSVAIFLFKELFAFSYCCFLLLLVNKSVEGL